MKKISVVLAVMLSVFFSLTLFSCGSSDNTLDKNESVYGKYYACEEGCYRGDEELYFMEITKDKCTFSLDSPAHDYTYTLDGNYLAIKGSTDGIDLGDNGLACIVNNGVALFVGDGIITAYCKRERSRKIYIKEFPGSAVSMCYTTVNPGSIIIR